MNEKTAIQIEETATELDESISLEDTAENEIDVCDTQAPQESKSEETTIFELQATIRSLKEQITELEKARDTQEKMLGQLTDFATLFPAVDIDCIPESVWETVKKGTSLAAAYALYEKRAEAERLKIEKINSINSARSAGTAGNNTANEFFTPDDVKKMSRAEVHANFAKIKSSMKKWN